MDERLQNKTIIIKCACNPQENNHILHIFKARQWRSVLRPGTKKFTPYLSAYFDKPWENHYRVRINGKWYRDTIHKYCFYTMPEIIQIISGLMEE